MAGGMDFPMGAGANSNLAFASQSPVDAMPASPTGHHDAMGNLEDRFDHNILEIIMQNNAVVKKNNKLVKNCLQRSWCRLGKIMCLLWTRFHQVWPLKRRLHMN